MAFKIWLPAELCLTSRERERERRGEIEQESKLHNKRHHLVSLNKIKITLGHKLMALTPRLQLLHKAKKVEDRLVRSYFIHCLSSVSLQWYCVPQFSAWIASRTREGTASRGMNLHCGEESRRDIDSTLLANRFRYAKLLVFFSSYFIAFLYLQTNVYY